MPDGSTVFRPTSPAAAGITGLLAAAAVAEAHELDLSGHTAPTIHAHVLCAVTKLRHLEWFHDHVWIERMLFDGFLEPEGEPFVPILRGRGSAWS